MGKVFCTKTKPNCNGCPMRAECKHFASAFTSARLQLPAAEGKPLMISTPLPTSETKHIGNLMLLPQPERVSQSETDKSISQCEPIIEEPVSPEPEGLDSSPEPEGLDSSENAIEDAFWIDNPEEIPVIRLNLEELAQNIQNYMEENNVAVEDYDTTKALVALTPEAASIPMPKLKNVSRLRTEHQVYELPDDHPLLEALDTREPDDPCPYLLSIWTAGETTQSVQPPNMSCNALELGYLCGEETCGACNAVREANADMVRGTLLIPCRTAMQGSFPLNGTYFQVNEVFADHESSLQPIYVPRALIWNLPRRMVYFGTSIPSIFKGLSMEEIQLCFWRGFVCIRGFDRKTRAPRPLIARLHFPYSKIKATEALRRKTEKNLQNGNMIS